MQIDEYVESLTVADFERDPYPIFARLRAERPVCFVPALDLWLVTRFEDILTVGSDAELFSSDQPDAPMNDVAGRPNILTATGEEHQDLRRSLGSKYRPRDVASYIDDLVLPIVADHLERLRGKDEVDLLAEYFEPISVRSLAAVLGLGHLDSDTLREWFHGLAVGAINYERDPAKFAAAAVTADDARATLQPLLDALVENPDDSTMAHMLWTGRDGTPRPAELIMPTLLVIVLGGMQEPGHGAATTLVGLLSEPGQLAWVQESPSDRVLRAVDEGLRWTSPIGTQAKRVTRDTVLAGTPLAEGSRMVVMLSSANRDESVFADPDRFDATRPAERTIPFGVGGHFCLGHAFSRSQMMIALRELLAAYPEISLDPTRTPEFTGWEFRAPTSVAVRLGAPA